MKENIKESSPVSPAKNKSVCFLRYWVTSGAEQYCGICLRLAGLLWLVVGWVFAGFNLYWLKLGITSSTWLHWKSARDSLRVSLTHMCTHLHTHTPHGCLSTLWRTATTADRLGEVPAFLWPSYHRHDQTEIMTASL